MLQKVIHVLNCIKDDYKSNRFIPILEDDFVSRFYYYWLKDEFDIYTNKIFVKTRILHNIPELKKRNKYDIVIGNRNIDRTRVYVIPEAVLEFKIFPQGFTASQLSKRRDEVIDDIKKLHAVNMHYKKDVQLFICIFDAFGWLQRYNFNENVTRLEKFCIVKEVLDPKINIVGVSAKDKQNALVFNY